MAQEVEQREKEIFSVDALCILQRELFRNARFRITFEVDEVGRFFLIEAIRAVEPADLVTDHITPRG